MINSQYVFMNAVEKQNREFFINSLKTTLVLYSNIYDVWHNQLPLYDVIHYIAFITLHT